MLPSDAKGLETGQDAAGSSEKKVLFPYFDSFLPPNTTRSTIKILLVVSLVSLTFRAHTVF